MTPAEFARVTAVTYLGQVHGTLAALEQMQMRRHDRGTIVLVGSALAYRRSRCNRPIAPPRRRCAASPTACAASSCTTAAGCA